MKLAKSMVIAAFLTAPALSIASVACSPKDIHQQTIIDEGCHFIGTETADFGIHKRRCLNALVSMVSYYYICKFNCSELTMRRYNCAVCLFNAVNDTGRFAHSANVSHCFRKKSYRYPW